MLELGARSTGFPSLLEVSQSTGIVLQPKNLMAGSCCRGKEGVERVNNAEVGRLAGGFWGISPFW